MDQLIAWLFRRRWLTALAAVCYFGLVVLNHRKVSDIFDWLAQRLSFKIYNEVMLGMGLSMVALAALALLSSILRSKQRLGKLIVLGSTVALVALSYHFLIVFNVEAIHFLQYALLAVPIFSMVKHYGATVFWTTALGAVDEAFQYFVLYRDNNTVYFDFNDIVLNLIGAGIGVTALYVLLSHPSRPQQQSAHRLPVLLAACIVAAVFALNGTGVVEFYPETTASAAPIVLSRKPLSAQFWTVPEQGRPFHILHPVEGMIATFLLILSYSLIDVLRARGSAGNANEE